MSKNTITTSIITFAITVALTACGAPRPAPEGGGSAEGATAGAETSGGNIADFALKDVDGKSRALSDYLGDNVILVSFWATWCEPCKKEMVQLQSLFDEHGESGLMILSISMDEPETQGDVRPYVKQRGFTFPVLLDAESQVTNQLNPKRSAPFSLIIGKDGSIVWEHAGYVPGDEKKVEEAVLQALGAAAP